jgi:hypothetical protein
MSGLSLQMCLEVFYWKVDPAIIDDCGQQISYICELIA